MSVQYEFDHPLMAIRAILVAEMGLDPERVNFYNQKWKIPPDPGLFITLEFRHGKAYANRASMPVVVGEDVVSKQGLNTRELYTIGVFSQNTDALFRKEEVLMAMKSTYAQQVMEKNSFKVSRTGDIQDVSAVEASARLYRFDIDLYVLAWYAKNKTVPFFDQFETVVETEDGKEATFTLEEE